MKKEMLQRTSQKYKKEREREYFEQFDANKFDNLKETDNTLETYGPPKLNQAEIV